jgi:hypothetical protein
MRKPNHFLLLVMALTAALLILGACSSTPSSSSSSKSKVPTLQVLQNSQKAMSQLKSAHVVLNMKGTGQQTGSTTAPSNITFSVTGSGDEALPNEEKMQLTTTQSVTNATSNLNEIYVGNTLYVQNDGGQWYALNGVNNVSNPFAGFGSLSITQLLDLLAHTQITDHGDQSLNGVTLRHITMKLDKYALEQLLDSNKQLVNLLGQQNINNAINHAKSFSATLDLWIDETTFYVHRSELKLNLNVDTASVKQSITPTPGATTQAAIPSSVITNLDSIVDLSNFNAPVTITPPASATPITVPTITATP